MTPRRKFQARCGNFYILVILLSTIKTFASQTTLYNCYNVICHGTKSHVFRSKEFTLTIALNLFSKRGTFCENLRKLKTTTLVGFRCISRELQQRRRRRHRGRQKSNRFILAKQQLCTCITLFRTFLYRPCTTTT